MGLSMGPRQPLPGAERSRARLALALMAAAIVAGGAVVVAWMILS